MSLALGVGSIKYFGCVPVCLSVWLTIARFAVDWSAERLSNGKVYVHHLVNEWKGLPQIWLDDISWTTIELIKFWSRSVEFPNLVAIFTKWNKANLG